MAVYSFRAECVHDLEVLVSLLPAMSIHDGTLDITEHYGVPDVEAQITTEASLEMLTNVIRCVPDGHVMLQTLRPVPLRQNSLERDYDKE